jgi:hypothetical protein
MIDQSALKRISRLFQEIFDEKQMLVVWFGDLL